MHGPINVKFNKIRSLMIINLLRISTPGCHHQGIFQIKQIQPYTLICVCIAISHSFIIQRL